MFVLFLPHSYLKIKGDIFTPYTENKQQLDFNNIYSIRWNKYKVFTVYT